MKYFFHFPFVFASFLNKVQLLKEEFAPQQEKSFLQEIYVVLLCKTNGKHGGFQVNIRIKIFLEKGQRHNILERAFNRINMVCLTDQFP